VPGKQPDIDPQRDVSSRQSGISTSPALYTVVNFKMVNTHMLVDQQNSDILSLGVILERRFNNVRLCLCICISKMIIHETSHQIVCGLTSIDDQEVLLLLIIDMSNPSQQQTRHGILRGQLPNHFRWISLTSSPMTAMRVLSFGLLELFAILQCCRSIRIGTKDRHRVEQ
jgi:hypothetical protein